MRERHRDYPRVGLFLRTHRPSPLLGTDRVTWSYTVLRGLGPVHTIQPVATGAHFFQIEE